MSNYDVVTVGSAVLDIFMKSDKFRLMPTDSVPGGIAMCEVYDGKMEVQEVVIASGGGGTNTAVSFAKKELKTAVIAEMGNDPAALVVYKDLEEDGVETRYVVQEQDQTTAVSAILIGEDGGRSVITYRGASAMLTKHDFPFDEIETRWLHISSLGGNIELLKQLLSWAKKKKIRVSLNPGMPEIDQRTKLLPLLSEVEVLFLNREEAAALFDLKLSDQMVWNTHAFPMGARVTVVTDGAHGGKVCIGDKQTFYEPEKVSRVINTTGAGDAFASGYIAALLYGKDYEQAVEWGKRNAKGVLGYIGAKRGLLTLAEINK
jgi:ribokinase